MFVKRHLNLSPSGDGLVPAYIRREDLLESGVLEDIRQSAQEEAEQILATAKAESDRLHEEFEQVFSRQVINVMQSLKNQQVNIVANVEQYATDVVITVLSQLMRDVDMPTRMLSMIRELSSRHVPSADLVLYCHPTVYSDVNEVVRKIGSHLFSVAEDDSLSVDALRMATDFGQVDISWKAFCDAVLASIQTANVQE
ncbi:hypothetical protein LMG33818_002204 [Halomonadaceae bacterium LMG 33818]|uniref:HrpE/YscL family type III secretion apparatus protein n=1 Tax=Cernens ardua TaxID=3402176 RepID=UPI003EDC967D